MSVNKDRGAMATALLPVLAVAVVCAHHGADEPKPKRKARKDKGVKRKKKKGTVRTCIGGGPNVIAGSTSQQPQLHAFVIVRMASPTQQRADLDWIPQLGLQR